MIRSILLAARLWLGLLSSLFCFLGIEKAEASISTPILGEDVNRLIVEAMASEGMEGLPQLNKSRKFLPCKSGMSVEPMFGTWKTVRVSCTDKGGWKVMVRTHLKTAIREAKNPQKAKAVPKKPTAYKTKVEMKVQRPVKKRKKATKAQQPIKTMSILALRRSMSRNDVIMPRDIITISVPVNSASGVFFNPDDIIGRKLKTSVTAKKPIQARHLKPKWLVEEDDEIIIQNHAGGINVDMLGLALENGQYGEWIKVQNLSSGIVVAGQIKNKKIISVNPKITRTSVVN